jgi:hypothetical protein
VAGNGVLVMGKLAADVAAFCGVYDRKMVLSAERLCDCRQRMLRESLKRPVEVWVR